MFPSVVGEDGVPLSIQNIDATLVSKSRFHHCRYLNKINSVKALQDLLYERSREGEELIRRKQYEIERLLQEQKYIREEIRLQRKISAKNAKFWTLMRKSMHEMEMEHTDLLLELLSAKADFLRKRDQLSRQKRTFHELYTHNTDNLNHILELESEIQKKREELESLRDLKPQLLSQLTEQIRIKKTRISRSEDLGWIQVDIRSIQGEMDQFKNQAAAGQMERDKKSIRHELSMRDLRGMIQSKGDRLMRLRDRRLESLSWENQPERTKAIFHRVCRAFAELQLNRFIEKRLYRRNVKLAGEILDGRIPSTTLVDELFLMRKLKKETELIRSIAVDGFEVDLGEDSARNRQTRREILAAGEVLQSKLSAYRSQVLHPEPEEESGDRISKKGRFDRRKLIEYLHLSKLQKLLEEQLEMESIEEDVIDYEEARSRVKKNLVLSWMRQITSAGCLQQDSVRFL